MGVTLVKDLELLWPRVSAYMLCGTGITSPLAGVGVTALCSPVPGWHSDGAAAIRL